MYGCGCGCGGTADEITIVRSGDEIDKGDMGGLVIRLQFPFSDWLAGGRGVGWRRREERAKVGSDRKRVGDEGCFAGVSGAAVRDKEGERWDVRICGIGLGLSSRGVWCLYNLICYIRMYRCSGNVTVVADRA